MSEGPAALSPARSRDHAESMDRMYRYQRHIYDLTRKYYLLGRDHMISGLNMPPGASLLEIGCGTGRNLALARRYFPTAELFGLDISAEMLVTARAKFAGDAHPPRLQVADATVFSAGDFGRDGFDRVMISYALSMIPDWQAAIDQAIEALAADGSLHIVDFGQQERLPIWTRTALQAWLTRFHVTPRPNMQEVLEQRAASKGLKLVFEPLWRGYAWHAVMTR
ncbi:MAG: class I SAM-dependent methyltransferase [Rhizobium sp.]|nr:class I SAM-dependent methyltransferase [Rhizobium sp.]